MTEDENESTKLMVSRDTILWKEKAACVGKQEYFFSDYKATAVREAKRICSDCEVRAQCLDHAMTHQEYGVWGGMTANERRVLKRKLRKMFKLAK